VHSFRIITAVLAWVFIGFAFYYRPDWIKWGLRTATHGIERSAMLYLPRGAIASKSSFENLVDSSGFRSQP
jgi:hypothetical protein